MTVADRARRTAEADALCADAYDRAKAPDTGVALVAVGGYGRGELAPYSDLDLVLVHDAEEPGEWAESVWYPLWDAAAKIDHSVRRTSAMIEAAGADVRVALGLLDLRHVAGDPNLTLRLKTTMLADWRRTARARLPELRAVGDRRHELVGELAHAAVPDLKEAEGGLRDATALKALVATWLVDVPHADLERTRKSLLDVRDVVQEAAGRATDRVAPELWAEIAARTELPDAAAAQRFVRELGRRMTHLSRLTWRRAEAAAARPTARGRARRPELDPVAPGVALSAGEVVLDGTVRPERDPMLLLRAAAEAAERDVVLAPPTAARLAQDGAALPEPWPREARDLLVRLLASGPGLLEVWETLEETGALARILPEWERIRLLPHASVIHRFTVDRHVIETCVAASGLIRSVSRPDVLMLAALLHDIGKGGLTEHSVAGEPIAREVAARLGCDGETADLVALLVRHHLLLAHVATTRDPDDPATVEQVTDHIRTPEALSLLTALTEADATATSPQAWSSWRAGLVRSLGERALALLVARAAGGPAPQLAEARVAVPDAVRRGETDVAVDVTPGDGDARLTVVGLDRVGLLADVAAALALLRVPVRAARAWSQDDFAVSVWEVADSHLDPAVLRTRFDGIVDGRVDPTSRLRAGVEAGLAPTVDVRPEASRRSTVLEVRAGNRPGVLALVLAALARLGITVRSAHIDTLGPQAVDVFYLQETDAGALSDVRAAEAAHAVRAALA